MRLYEVGGILGVKICERKKGRKDIHDCCVHILEENAI
jgi:hypothetical protein